LQVQVPNQDRFSSITHTPELLSLWVTDDGLTRMSVATLDHASTIKLLPKSVEEGFVQEFGGRLVQSGSSQVDGRTVLSMTVQSEAEGKSVYVSQRLFSVGNRAYKLIAVTFGRNVSDDRDVQQYLESLRIHATASSEPVNAPLTVRNDKNFTNDLNELSKLLGGVAVWVLIIIGIVYWCRRPKHRATKRRGDDVQEFLD